MNSKRVNYYKCQECSMGIFTVDREKGVTPMFLACRATPDCNGMMVSSGYPHDDWFSLTPVKYEWYKPDLDDIQGDEYEHVIRGGLLLRRLKKSIPLIELPDIDDSGISYMDRK